MVKYIVFMLDETGGEFSVEIEIPDMVENITEWVQDEYPECQIVLIKPARF